MRRSLELRRVRPEDLELVAEFLRNRGVEASADALSLLMRSRRFYGVLAEDGGRVVGLMVTDPSRPPGGDEAYHVHFLEPMVEEGYEDLAVPLAERAVSMVPVSEVTVIYVNVSERGVRAGLLSALMDKGFQLKEPIRLVKGIA